MKKAKKRGGSKARQEPLSETLQRRGLAANLDEQKILLARGLKEHEVYTLGQGAETIAQCLWSIRGRRPAELLLVSDLRIFCADQENPTKAEVTDAMAFLHANKIKVRRILPDGEEDNPHVLVKQAHRAVSNNPFLKRGRAKRVGAKGGAAKGFSEKAKRDAICAPHIVRALVAEFGVRWVAKRLGKPFSRGVLSRNYT